MRSRGRRRRNVLEGLRLRLGRLKRLGLGRVPCLQLLELGLLRLLSEEGLRGNGCGLLWT